MNKNQECMLTILKNHGDKLSTLQIINLTDEYPDLCMGCRSGSHVISAGMELVKKGKIKREVGKGGFYWSLMKK